MRLREAGHAGRGELIGIPEGGWESGFYPLLVRELTTVNPPFNDERNPRVSDLRRKLQWLRASPKRLLPGRLSVAMQAPEPPAYSVDA